VRSPEQDPDRNNVIGWIGETVRARGFLGALRFYAAGLVELVRDLTPARRRSRYGDVDFDFEHGVDTTWATVGLRTRVREWLRGVQYQASEPELFREIIESLPVAPPQQAQLKRSPRTPVAVEDFTFLDLGSGKGRTLLMASNHPFRRIIGVELLAELNAIAAQNIARYKSDQQKCFNIEARAGDARDFAFPAEPTVLYLFNPFPEHVLREVLANLEKSLTSSPRPMYVLYHNLVHEAVFTEQKWLRELRRTHQYAVYEAAVQGGSPR
jgi:SAM-dependent methyltransferase